MPQYLMRDEDGKWLLPTATRRSDLVKDQEGQWNYACENAKCIEYDKCPPDMSPELRRMKPGGGPVRMKLVPHGAPAMPVIRIKKEREL